MLKTTFYFLAFFFQFVFLGAQDILANQTISGNISVEGNKSLSKIIVYLENKSEIISSPPSTHVVNQKRLRFSPNMKIVVKGDLVQFLNSENRQIDHNVYSLSETKSFDLGLGEKGSTLETTFNKPGVLNYYCSVHKLMEGRMVILPTSYYTKLNKPGAFKIKDVPSGEWNLKAILFHRRYKTVPLKLKVSEKNITNVKLTVVKK